MKAFRLAAMAASAAVLAGCAVPRPPETPATVVPPQWYAPLPHNGSLTDLKSWWLQLEDPLLIELIEAAQAASPTVAVAGARIDQARAARTAANAALLPTVDGQASVSRGNNQQGLTQPATIAQLGLQTAWEIDLFGANANGARAAQARLEGARAGWHEARVSVAAETANGYVRLRTCEEQLEVTRNDAASRAETARLTGLSADAGFTPPASAALARASAAEASARVAQQRAACELDYKALVALTAWPEPDLRQKVAASRTQSSRAAHISIASVPAAVLAQRPDVYAAEREVAAASAEVGSARAERFPKLSLTGSIATGQVRTGGVTTDVSTWAIGPLALSLPIFDAGRRAANVDAAQGRYDEAVANYTGRVRQAVREVEEALVALESANARARDLQTAVEGYRRSFAATQALYRGGLASLIELEDQRRVALAAETAFVALQQERLAAWIALYRAAGGGWARPEADAVAARP